MEIFVYSDLSGFSDLQHVIINVFSSPSEEVRSAASYALGKSHVIKLLVHTFSYFSYEHLLVYV